MKVAVLKLLSRIGLNTLYDIKWRLLMPNERKLIDAIRSLGPGWKASERSAQGVIISVEYHGTEKFKILLDILFFKNYIGQKIS